MLYHHEFIMIFSLSLLSLTLLSNNQVVEFQIFSIMLLFYFHFIICLIISRQISNLSSDSHYFIVIVIDNFITFLDYWQIFKIWKNHLNSQIDSVLLLYWIFFFTFSMMISYYYYFSYDLYSMLFRIFTFHQLITVCIQCFCYYYLLLLNCQICLLMDSHLLTNLLTSLTLEISSILLTSSISYLLYQNSVKKTYSSSLVSTLTQIMAIVYLCL